jgi:hypothetical protein
MLRSHVVLLLLVEGLLHGGTSSVVATPAASAAAASKLSLNLNFFGHLSSHRLSEPSASRGISTQTWNRVDSEMV